VLKEKDKDLSGDALQLQDMTSPAQPSRMEVNLIAFAELDRMLDFNRLESHATPCGK
jgi:hypothetical protein